MSFLAPWAAWFLFGLPVIVLLYLLKVKRRSLPVSTLLFWHKVLQENRRRALFQRLRSVLSLLLQLLIFLLIVAALAKPAFEKSARQPSATVLIFDTRARMQAVEADGHSRLDRARLLAEPFVHQASEANPIAILTANASGQVLAPFGTDEKVLEEALAGLRATDTSGDLAPSIRLANELLNSRSQHGRILVFTDGTAAPIASAAPLEFIPTGTVHDNVAITRFATRALLNSPETSEVLLEIRNFGRVEALGNLELAFDGRLLDAKPFVIPPNGQKLELFPSLPHPGRNARGWLSARLDCNDALLRDNIAYAVLPPVRPHRVLLVSKGNVFLEKLLGANPQVSFELLAPETFQLSMASKFDCVILDRFLPDQFDLSQSSGNFLFVAQSPFNQAGVPLASPIVPEADSTHPILRLVNLQNVNILRANTIAVPTDPGDWQFQSPIRSFEQPLMITGRRHLPAGEQRVAAVGFDFTQSDLPLRIAFPILVTNTVRWLAGETSSAPTSLRAGEILPLGANQTLWTKAQTRTDEPAVPSPEDLAANSFQPLENGYYQLNLPNGKNWVAVNTFSEAESNLLGQNIPALPIARVESSSWAQLSHWALWKNLALAALILSCLEWWLFHRRRTE